MQHTIAYALCFFVHTIITVEYQMKHLTMKELITGTAIASLALLLAAGSAYAGPGKGPKKELSVGFVENACTLESSGMLTVETTVTDDSGDTVIPLVVDSITVQPMIKFKGNRWYSFGSGSESSTENPNTEMFNLCAAGFNGTAVNAEVTVVIDGLTYVSRCDDDPSTEDDESDLQTEGLCDE